MCGIAGFRSAGNENNKVTLDSMLATITHRGPDEKGVLFDKDLSIGMRRLSIIDLNTGSQPIFNEDKSIVIVFNGEIYNFQKLYRDLKRKGHKFRTKTDTEAIIHLYEDLGIRCVEKLNGMFAFCIYDKSKGKLFFAVDRAGKKPLYIYHSGPNFAFSSELKSFYKLPFFKKRLNIPALDKFFLYGYIPSPLTPYLNTVKLPGGSLAVFDMRENSLTYKNYWDFDYSEKLDLSEAEWVKKIDRLLTQSVRSRLVSDVPLGCFLSGGVDSSLVVACMSKFLKGRDIKTFSIGFDEQRVNESNYARQVADLYHTDHHLKIFPQNEALSVSREIFTKMDEPLADPSILPTFLLSQFTRGYVTVSLSGDGGDEMFGGYPKYYIHRYARYLDMLPEKLKLSLAEKISQRLKTSPNNKYLNYKAIRFLNSLKYPPILRNQIWSGSFLPDEAGHLISDIKSNAVDLMTEAPELIRSQTFSDPLDIMLYLDAKLMLKDAYLTKVDRASMAASLEVRSPFLDKSILDITGRIPLGLKVKGRQTKYLLKLVAEKYFPRELVYRHKQGFGLPLAEWFRRKELTSEIRELLGQRRGVDRLSTSYINSLIRMHQNGTFDYSTQLWTIYAYLNWVQYNL